VISARRIAARGRFQSRNLFPSSSSTASHSGFGRRRPESLRKNLFQSFFSLFFLDQDFQDYPFASASGTDVGAGLRLSFFRASCGSKPLQGRNLRMAGRSLDFRTCRSSDFLRRRIERFFVIEVFDQEARHDTRPFPFGGADPHRAAFSRQPAGKRPVRAHPRRRIPPVTGPGSAFFCFFFFLFFSLFFFFFFFCFLPAAPLFAREAMSSPQPR